MSECLAWLKLGSCHRVVEIVLVLWLNNWRLLCVNLNHCLLICQLVLISMLATLRLISSSVARGAWDISRSPTNIRPTELRFLHVLFSYNFVLRVGIVVNRPFSLEPLTTVLIKYVFDQAVQHLRLNTFHQDISDLLLIQIFANILGDASWLKWLTHVLVRYLSISDEMCRQYFLDNSLLSHVERVLLLLFPCG